MVKLGIYLDPYNSKDQDNIIMIISYYYPTWQQLVPKLWTNKGCCGVLAMPLHAKYRIVALTGKHSQWPSRAKRAIKCLRIAALQEPTMITCMATGEQRPRTIRLLKATSWELMAEARFKPSLSFNLSLVFQPQSMFQARLLGISSWGLCHTSNLWYTASTPAKEVVFAAEGLCFALQFKTRGHMIAAIPLSKAFYSPVLGVPSQKYVSLQSVRLVPR